MTPLYGASIPHIINATLITLIASYFILRKDSFGGSVVGGRDNKRVSNRSHCKSLITEIKNTLKLHSKDLYFGPDLFTDLKKTQQQVSKPSITTNIMIAANMISYCAKNTTYFSLLLLRQNLGNILADTI